MAKSVSELKSKLILSVGTHQGKRPLSPVEVAKAFEFLEASGMHPKELADLVSFKGTSMIGKFKRLLLLPEEIQVWVDWGNTSGPYISFSSASLLSGLKDSRDQNQVKDSVLKYTLRKSEIQQIVEIRKKFKKSIEECIESILKLRPEVIQRYIFIGSITDKNLISRLSELSENERNATFISILSSHISLQADCSGRLGENKFSLVGDESFSEEIEKLKPDFATVVRGWIQDALTK
tara:strand:+ start:2691 stop:3398 length:708 start_codon:yes stop_codon:yes gene_type:complete